MLRLFDRTYTTTILEEDEREVCLVHFSHWVTRVTGAYFITFWWFRCLFVQLLPCISLVILNILLFSAMRRAEQRRRRLTINKTKQGGSGGKRRLDRKRLSIFGGRSREKEDRRQRDANSTTLMLIVVIAVFLTVEIPQSVLGLLHIVSSRYKLLPVGFS